MTSTGIPASLSLADADATERLGAALGDLVVDAVADATFETNVGLSIHLSGDLGAGKTTLARALLRRLGVTGRIKSPTYALVEPYVVEIPRPIESRQRVKLYCYHFDFYRFENPQDWIDAGFRDHFADASLRIVEWPDRARAVLPAPDLAVALVDADDGRVATLAAHTDAGRRWLSRLRTRGGDGAAS